MAPCGSRSQLQLPSLLPTAAAAPRRDASRPRAIACPAPACRLRVSRLGLSASWPRVTHTRLRCVGGGAAEHPSWVRTMNGALEQCPVATLLSFVALDLGSALCLWWAFESCQLSVDADFAVAYALSKAVRLQRLALDAAAAGALVRLYPPLQAVRVSLLLDAAGALVQALRSRLLRSDATAKPTQPSLLSHTAAEAKRLADEYGLAYMAAKNVIGPVSIAAIYVAMQQGVDVQGWLGSFGGTVIVGAGRTAGRMAFASWCSVLLFPAVVLGAAHLGPVLQGGAARMVERAKLARL